MWMKDEHDYRCTKQESQKHPICTIMQHLSFRELNYALIWSDLGKKKNLWNGTQSASKTVHTPLNAETDNLGFSDVAWIQLPRALNSIANAGTSGNCSEATSNFLILNNDSKKVNWNLLFKVSNSLNGL